MDWPFAAAEFVGGIFMVILIALLFRLTLTPRLVTLTRAHAEQRALGRMEGHATMDISLTGGSLLSRLLSNRGFTAISHYFVMDWASIWQDLAAGFLIACASAAWVPDLFWRAFFLTNDPTLAAIEGPLVGPLVAIISFVCSVGNVPLAAVLWWGGISLDVVVSFIFADLIVLPILDIYRRYYGGKVTLYVLVTFYTTMAAAGYLVELLFGALSLIPTSHTVGAITQGVRFNYTIVLNLLFLVVAAILVGRFLRTGGPAMLRMMSKPEPAAEAGHHHHGEAHAGH